MVKYLTQHMAYGFISCTSDFSYLCSNKNKHLAHMYGGIKTLKYNFWTTLRVAHHGCKNLTHTSKTRQVKRTQMVTTGRFTIVAFDTFSDCKESNASHNETVARKQLRFKPEPSSERLHYRGHYICATGLDILNIL